MNDNKMIRYSEGFAVVSDFNGIDIKSLQSLKDVDMPVRIIMQDTPNQEKINILNDNVLIHNASMITLVLVSDKDDWINLLDFRALTLIENIEIHNKVLTFNSIYGVQYFERLKSFSLFYRYGKDIELELLSSCVNLERLTLDEPLTKKQHEKISHIRNVKRIKVKGLNPSFLINELPDIEYLEVYNLQEASLGIKLPNLKKMRIYNSHKITEMDFLSSLKKLEWFYLYGLSNVEKLPDFSTLFSLEKISLQNMKRLADVDSIRTIKKLSGLCIRSTSLTLDHLDWLTPENFPFIKNLIIDLKSKKESDSVYEQFSDIDIEKRLNLE